MTTDLGSIELGGTKTLVGVGSSSEGISEMIEIPTTSPDETLGSAVEFLRRYEVAAVGIAAFGPLQLQRDSDDFGTILATPKPGWAGTDLIGTVSRALEVPVGLDTDVNGAALAEGRWGAARGIADHAYVTVGTGIGVGVVRSGEVYRGLAHVEMGHIPVSVIEGDEFSGSCPFHGTCLEGMASGKALEDRFGVPALELSGESQDRAVSLLAGYLGQGLRAMAYTFGPERVVIGGGVSAMPGFFDAVRVGFLTGLGGYLRLPEYSEPGYLSPAELSGRSGLMGGLIIAEGVL